MSVEFKPTSTIIANLGFAPDGRTTKFLTATCAKHMDKYVPMREGILRQYIINENHIEYDTPYARYQYYGIRQDGSHKVKHYTTPGTGPKWDERMKSAEMDTVVREVQNFLDRGGNNARL